MKLSDLIAILNLFLNLQHATVFAQIDTLHSTACKCTSLKIGHHKFLSFLQLGSVAHYPFFSVVLEKSKTFCLTPPFVVHRRMKIIQNWEQDVNIFFLLRVSQGDIVLYRRTQDLCPHTVDLEFCFDFICHNCTAFFWKWHLCEESFMHHYIIASGREPFFFAHGIEPNMTAYSLHVDFSIEVCTVLHFFLPHSHIFFSFGLSIHIL